MRDALRATGRPIVFSLSVWGVREPWTWGPRTANLWRTTSDIKDSWQSVMHITALNAPLWRHARPGSWNDPDMLEVGNGGMTDTEYRTHFSLWAEMAAPLLAGTDLRHMTAATRKILTNRDVIAVDQDRLGVQGHPVLQPRRHVGLGQATGRGRRRRADAQCRRYAGAGERAAAHARVAPGARLPGSRPVDAPRRAQPVRC